MKDEVCANATHLFIPHPSSFILSLFLGELLEQTVHARAVFFYSVSHEMNLWCTWQVE